MNSPEQAQLYFTDDDRITCNLCFHNCRLKEGQTGVCGVNENRNGKLYSLVYGYPDALHPDPIEKKPLYHVDPGSSILSIGTVGCNFRCPFCQNYSLSMGKPDRNREMISNEMIISQIKRSGSHSLAFTYNEPTVSWLWFRDLAKMAKDKGYTTVMVTNGAMSKAVCEEMGELIDAINVDLKCGSNEHYKKTLRGDRQQVLQSLDYLNKAGVWIEITTLLVTDISDSKEDLQVSADEIMDILGPTVPWHLSAYRPAYKYHAPHTSPHLVDERCDQLRDMGFYYVYPGNTSSPGQTICPKCGTLLINRYGYYVENSLVNGACPHCSRPLEGRLL